MCLTRSPHRVTSSGVLPKVVQRLLERRREVKRLLKTERNEAKCKQLDIRQKVRCLRRSARSRFEPAV